jgi:hypothetical protein
MTISDYIPQKINEGCSLVYLIDEDLCLANSYEIINYNIASLSAALVNVEKYTSFWNNAYTNFTANSATWLTATSRLQIYNKLWSSAYSTVNALSANWKTEFTVYYPFISQINDWYSSEATNKLNVTNWLQNNFPIKNYTNLQKVNVQINLKHAQPFSFTFSRSLNETCAPAGGQTAVCTTCSRPHRGCYHHGGAAGWGGCDNAYSHCGIQNKQLEAKFSCVGRGGKELSIGYTLNSTDNSIARIITLKFQKIQNTWRLI